jgi:hypothetical protein
MPINLACNNLQGSIRKNRKISKQSSEKNFMIMRDIILKPSLYLFKKLSLEELCRLMIIRMRTLISEIFITMLMMIMLMNSLIDKNPSKSMIKKRMKMKIQKIHMRMVEEEVEDRNILRTIT